MIVIYFFTDTTPTEIYTLSLHDALPICGQRRACLRLPRFSGMSFGILLNRGRRDRKSTRLNSSHMSMSYAVFCLKKKIVTASKIELIFGWVHYRSSLNGRATC